jgi:hypothetical protein
VSRKTKENNMFKRVVAHVGDADFYKFLKRVKEEDLEIGDVLASMVIVYAHGGVVKIPRSKENTIKKAVRDNSYLRDVRKKEKRDES